MENSGGLLEWCDIEWEKKHLGRMNFVQVIKTFTWINRCWNFYWLNFWYFSCSHVHTNFFWGWVCVRGVVRGMRSGMKIKRVASITLTLRQESCLFFMIYLCNSTYLCILIYKIFNFHETYKLERNITFGFDLTS